MTAINGLLHLLLVLEHVATGAACCKQSGILCLKHFYCLSG